MINAEDHHGGIIACLDSIYHNIWQTRHDQFACSGDRTFAPDIRKLAKKFNGLGNTCADR
jgi:hypothetical protein